MFTPKLYLKALSIPCTHKCLKTSTNIPQKPGKPSTSTTPPLLPQTLDIAAPWFLIWILTNSTVQMIGTTLMLNSKVSSPNKFKSEVVSSDEEFFEIPKGHFLNGVNNGLYLTLDSEAFESSYDDEFSLSTGFLMTLTYPFTRPIVKQKGR